MFTVKSRNTQVSFTGTYDTVNINGDYRIGEDSAIKEINGSVTEVGTEKYLGGFNVYQEGDSLKLNKHGIDINNVSVVDTAIEACIVDIKTTL